MVGDFWRLMATKSPVAVAGPTRPAVPVPETRALPAGALALVLTWDAAGRCCDVEFGGAGGGGCDVAAHAAALRGDGWLDVLHADDRSWAAERVLAVIASGESREAAVRLSQGDRWAVLHIEPADDGDGDGAIGREATAREADPAAASGVLVDATHSLGTTARMARLVGCSRRAARRPLRPRPPQLAAARGRGAAHGPARGGVVARGAARALPPARRPRDAL